MVDYREGIFDKIVSINFGGGQWMALYALGFTDNPNAVLVSFPDMAAGTPGFTLLDAGATIGVKTAGSTAKVSAANNRLMTQAGAPTTGVAISRRGFRSFGPTAVEVFLFLKLNAQFPATKFRVRSGPKVDAASQHSTFAAFAVPKNRLKTTSVVGFQSTGQGFTIDGKAVDAQSLFQNPGVADITVDPKVPSVSVASGGGGGGALH